MGRYAARGSSRRCSPSVTSTPARTVVDRQGQGPPPLDAPGEKIDFAMCFELGSIFPDEGFDQPGAQRCAQTRYSVCSTLFLAIIKSARKNGVIGRFRMSWSRYIAGLRTEGEPRPGGRKQLAIVPGSLTAFVGVTSANEHV